MTHPHDAALLNDLVDDRLTPAAADELRRRIADEPALAAAHAELLRMRAAVAAMPVPVTVPSDFLARVRARAGLPPSVPVASAAAPPVATPSVAAAPPTAVASRAASGAPAPGTTPPDAGTGSDAGAGRDASSVTERAPGRVLPFTRFAVPIAAALGIVLGGGIYLATRFDRAPGSTSSARVAPSERTEDRAAGEKRAAEPAGAARSREDGTLDRSSGNGSPGNWGPGETAPSAPAAGPTTSGAPAPVVAPPITAGTAGGGDAAGSRFRAPGGAVPEGLRRPSDVPGAPPPPPVPVPPPTTEPPDPSGPAGVPPPTAPTSPRPTTATTGRAPVATEPAAGATDDAESASDGRSFGARAARRGSAAKPGQPAPESLAAGLLRAEEGVDEVVVVRAASVDEARALLSVLTLRPAGDGAAYRGLDVVGPADALAKPAPATHKQEGDEAGDEKARRADADALGSFVAELTPAAYDALVAARDASRAELHDADDAGAGPLVAPPSPSPRPGVATEPKDDAPGTAYGRSGAGTKDAPPGADAPKAETPELPAGAGKAAGPGPAKGAEPGEKATDKGAEKGAAKAPVGGARGAKPKGTPGAPAATPSVPPTVPPSEEDENATGADAPRPTSDASAAVRRVRIVVLPR